MISRQTIRKTANEVALRFKPARIILFGSYAYGKPTPDSDVDLLVVMPCKGRSLDVSFIGRSTRRRSRLPTRLDRAHADGIAAAPGDG